METEEAKGRRSALRWHPIIVEALEAWWTVTDANGDGAISRDECIILYKKVRGSTCV